MYPKVLETELVGTYPARTKSGGGYVWDEVLEYRVWMSPANGAPDDAGGDDYYYVFETYESAEAYAKATEGAEPPLALVLQKEYIDEPRPGAYRHIRQERLTEWPVEFLSRPKRSSTTIRDFFSPDAPPNRLEILRGLTDENGEEDAN